MILGVWGRPGDLLEPSWKQVPKKAWHPPPKNTSFWEAFWIQFRSQAGSQKSRNFKLKPERSQSDIWTHLGAQGGHKVKNWELWTYFGVLFVGRWEQWFWRPLLYNIHLFRIIGYLQIEFVLMFFSTLNPGLAQKAPWLTLFMILMTLEDFRVPPGMP